MKKAVFRVLKYLSLFFALLLLLLGAGVWFVASGSLSSEKLTPLIEMAVARLVPGSKVEIGTSSLGWDPKRHTITIEGDNVRYLDTDGALLVLTPKIELEANIWSLLTGNILPRRMLAEGSVIYLTRTQKGAFLLGEDRQAGPEVKQKASDQDGVPFLPLLQNLALELSNKWLRQDITILNATFQINDKEIEQRWTIVVPEIKILHTRKETTGQANLEVRQGDKVSTAALTYRYDRQDSLHKTKLSFHDIYLPSLVGDSAKLAALAGIDLPLTGEFEIGTDDDLFPMQGRASLSLGAGKLGNADLWKAPLPVKDGRLNLRYDNEQGQIVLSDTLIHFDGPSLSLSGHARAPSHKRYAWKLPRFSKAYDLTIKLENLKIDAYDAYWPQGVLTDAHDWITESLSKGVFPAGEVTLKGEIDWEDLNQSTLDTGFGKVEAKGGSVLYMPGMPSVDGVDAVATFTFHDMDVRISAGRTGAIRLQPFTIKMRDLHKDVPTIEIPAQISGPVRDILKLIDSPPLGYAKEVGIDPADASGTAQGLLTLKMPMVEDLDMEAVKASAKATLRGVGFKKLIPGIEISQGALSFDLYEGGFAIKGRAALNGASSQIDWASRFSEDPTGKQPLSRATVKMRVKPENWAAFGLGDLIETKGEVPLTLRYANIKAGLSTLGGDADMTSAAVKLASIGWDKPEGLAATLTFDGTMPDGKPYAITALDLQGKGVRVKGSASVDMKSGALLRAEMSPFVVGRSNASVSYAKNQSSGAEKIHIAGESFDMTGLGNDDAQAAPAAQDLSLQLIKLFTSETGFITSARIKARRDALGWQEIDFKGVAQGVTPIEVDLKPEGAFQVFSIKTDNFGNLMRGMGYTDGITGGNLTVEGRSSEPASRKIDGKVNITEFTVHNVPVFARLVNAISPFGFIDLITGRATFNKLNGEFSWQGDEVELRKVRAAGSVVGINVDGHINIDTGMAKLSGAVVPFSFVNGIIGSIPLLGHVITGGDGQGVLAASYKIDGPLSDARVSVNPVSLLAPGFLRNLFFSNGESEDKHDPKKETP